MKHERKSWTEAVASTQQGRDNFDKIDWSK